MALESSRVHSPFYQDCSFIHTRLLAKIHIVAFNAIKLNELVTELFSNMHKKE